MKAAGTFCFGWPNIFFQARFARLSRSLVSGRGWPSNIGIVFSWEVVTKSSDLIFWFLKLAFLVSLETKRPLTVAGEPWGGKL